MDRTLASENELLERRLTLMRELASSPERAYAAAAQADLHEMSAQTAQGKANLLPTTSAPASTAATDVPERLELSPESVRLAVFPWARREN